MVLRIDDSIFIEIVDMPCEKNLDSENCFLLAKGLSVLLNDQNFLLDLFKKYSKSGELFILVPEAMEEDCLVCHSDNFVVDFHKLNVATNIDVSNFNEKYEVITIRR